ncbi:hypothetical protein [Ruegeria atlantica]|uniref:hypothetical protein n=1 Tax=Ruegeria atlantica TaxID=81569 RepID=UPI00147C70B4|nr:hypothetical protein [Ruegeria atlantica]
MPFLAQNKEMQNFMESLLRDHNRYLPIVEFLDNVIKNAEELDWEDCERIGFELGQQNGSAFCAGIRTGMISALEVRNERQSERSLEPILAFAAKLNLNSADVEESDIQALRDAGWSDQTAEDVIGLVAALKVYSVLANGLGFNALPADVFAEMGKATVQMDGYTSMFTSFLSQPA